MCGLEFWSAELIVGLGWTLRCRGQFKPPGWTAAAVGSHTWSDIQFATLAAQLDLLLGPLFQFTSVDDYSTDVAFKSTLMVTGATSVV